MTAVLADNEKYDILEKIGHGSFGVIRKVRRKADAKIQCRKEINYLKMSMKEREQLHAEFSILSSLNHPNIVQYYYREHHKASQDLYIYMEYCGGGDLGMIIKDLKKNNQLAKEDFVWRIFAQLVTALYRCHNGVDAPEPGNNPFAQLVKHTDPKSKVMILHRDLKPENVFLGEDQAVKLGDFGLSKLMQSHDFASTYVGTPFYMSPEICNAEKYTSASDIWALGCIMHELCTAHTPFDAKSHIQLVQKIRKCELQMQVSPTVYSRELREVITRCLNVNPNRRPDTASLLTIPYVWIARKGMEMVELGKDLKAKENLASQRLQSLEADQAAFREEIESQLRREWEVKARLEINRQVEVELEKLRRKFDREVDEKVQSILSRRMRRNTGSTGSKMPTPKDHPTSHTSTSAPSAVDDKGHLSHGSSLSTNGTEDDSALSTDNLTDLTTLSNLSLDSPRSSTTKPPISTAAGPKKAAKTPFARSKTTFDSPADITMAEPSPMTISSLALSPRRNAAAQAQATAATHTGRNIFAEDANIRQKTELGGKAKWEPTLSSYSFDNDENAGSEREDDDDDDDLPELPSPTRPKVPAHLTSNRNGNLNKDPFKVPMRPGLGPRQMTTATMQKLTTQPTLFPSSNANAAATRATGIPIAPTSTTSATAPTTELITGGLHRANSDAGIGKLRSSPDRLRRMSKIPSSTTMSSISNTNNQNLAEATSPTRAANANAGVGLASAGAGGLKSKAAGGAAGAAAGGGGPLMNLAQARAGGRPVSRVPAGAVAAGSGGAGEGVKFAARLAELEGAKEERDAVAVWDPEREVEMPSPFLVRRKEVGMGVGMGVGVGRIGMLR